MNNINLELKGKKVAVIKDNFVDSFQEIAKDGFLCEGGFGCSKATNGRMIYGKWLANNQDDAISGFDVLSIINE